MISNVSMASIYGTYKQIARKELHSKQLTEQTKTHTMHCLSIAMTSAVIILTVQLFSNVLLKRETAASNVCLSVMLPQQSNSAIVPQSLVSMEPTSSEIHGYPSRRYRYRCQWIVISLGIHC